VSRISYSKQYEFSIHRNCVNFRNGFCTLIGVAVDPNEPACQNFTPKSMAETPQISKVYTGTKQPYQSHPPLTGYGLPRPYAYPPWIGYGQGYSTPQYRYGYGYRTRYGSGPNFSASTAPKQGAGFLSMSSGRRGGGRGGGGGGGRGRGRMGGFAAGPGGSCVCPNCGYSTSHVVGTPCYQQTCPKCGSRMTRGS